VAVILISLVLVCRVLVVAQVQPVELIALCLVTVVSAVQVGAVEGRAAQALVVLPWQHKGIMAEMRQA
jgi:hypothetical protein